MRHTLTKTIFACIIIQFGANNTYPSKYVLLGDLKGLDSIAPGIYDEFGTQEFW